MKVRKKPVEVEAIQWMGDNRFQINKFIGVKANPEESLHAFTDEGQVIIKTLEGNHVANIMDWIIKGVKGEFYPIKPDIFAETYDIIGE